MECINQNAISAYWARENTKKAITDFMDTSVYATILSNVYGHIRRAANKGEGMTVIDFTKYIKRANLSPNLVGSSLGISLINNGYKVEFRAPKKKYFLLVFWGVSQEDEQK